MEPWLPIGYHLNIVTRKRIAQWDIAGLVDVIVSPKTSVLAASETPGEQRILAVSNGRAVTLHDLSHCKVQNRHKLGKTSAGIQLLAFGHFGELYFTIEGFDFVFGYSLSKDKVDRKIELLSAARTLVVSKTHLLVSCYEQAHQILLVALQSEDVWRFSPNTSDSTIVATAFHPVRTTIFAVFDKTGTLSVYDAARVVATGPRTFRGRLGSLGDLHTKSCDDIKRPVIAIAFVPAFPARLVSVGCDRKGHLLDCGSNPQILSTWDLGCSPTCVAVLSLPGMVSLSDTAGEQLRTLVAVGYTDGHVSLADSKGLLSQNIVVDLRSTSITSVEWVRGPVGKTSTKTWNHRIRNGSERIPTDRGSNAVFKGSIRVINGRRFPSATMPTDSDLLVRCDDSSSTPKASQVETRVGYDSPMSRRSSIASFSSALSHLQSPVAEASDDTIIVRRLSDPPDDFGFADVDATRVYTKPKRPQTAGQSRPVQPASNVGHTGPQPDWQTMQLSSPAEILDDQDGQEYNEQPTQMEQTLSPASPSAPPGSHMTSLTSWSKYSATPAMSPTRTSRQRFRPPGTRSLAATSGHANDTSRSLRRSVPVNQAMAALLHTRSSPIKPAPPKPVLYKPIVSYAGMRGLATVVSSRTQATGSPSLPKPRDALEPPRPLTAADKPLPNPPSTPPSSRLVISTRGIEENVAEQDHHVGQSQHNAPETPMSPSIPRGVLSAHHGHHSCPCNCAVVASIKRLQTQVLILNDRLVNTEDQGRGQPRQVIATSTPAQINTFKEASAGRGENGEGWMRVGRFMVRRAEGTESRSSWRRRTGRRKVRVLHRRPGGSD